MRLREPDPILPQRFIGPDDHPDETAQQQTQVSPMTFSRYLVPSLLLGWKTVPVAFGTGWKIARSGQEYQCTKSRLGRKSRIQNDCEWPVLFGKSIKID